VGTSPTYELAPPPSPAVGATPTIGYASVLRRTLPMLPEWTGTGTDAAPTNADAVATPTATDATHADLTTQLQSRVALMSQIQQRLINARKQSSDLQMLLNESRTEQLRLEAALCDRQGHVIALQARVTEQMVHDQHLIAAASEPYVQITRNQMQEYIALRSSALASSTRALDRRLAAALGPTMPWTAASDPYDTDEDDEGDPWA